MSFIVHHWGDSTSSQKYSHTMILDPYSTDCSYYISMTLSYKLHNRTGIIWTISWPMAKRAGMVWNVYIDKEQGQIARSNVVKWGQMKLKDCDVLKKLFERIEYNTVEIYSWFITAFCTSAPSNFFLQIIELRKTMIVIITTQFTKINKTMTSEKSKFWARRFDGWTVFMRVFSWFRICFVEFK